MARRKPRVSFPVGGETLPEKKSHNWVPPEEWMAPLRGMSHEELTTIAMAAEELGISKNSIYRRIKTGRLPFTRVGEVTLIRKTDVKEWQELKRGFPAYVRRRKKAVPSPGSWLLR